MKALLNPNRTQMNVIVRHYTSQPLYRWLEMWERGLVKVIYTTAEWDNHHSSYGENWIEFELTLKLSEEVPYQMDLKTSPPDEWGWRLEKGWFHTPPNMMRIIRNSS